MSDELSRPPFPAEPKMGIQPVPVVERSPTGIAMVGQTLVRIATGAKALALTVAGIVVLLPPMPWTVQVLTVCAGVYGVSELITGAGPGIRKEAGAAPVLPWEGKLPLQGATPTSVSAPPRTGPVP